MKELLLFLFLPPLSLGFWEEVHTSIIRANGKKITLPHILLDLYNYILHDNSSDIITTTTLLGLMFTVLLPIFSINLTLQIYYTNRYIDNFPELYI